MRGSRQQILGGNFQTDHAPCEWATETADRGSSAMSGVPVAPAWIRDEVDIKGEGLELLSLMCYK